MTEEKFKEILSYISTAIRGTEYENHVFAVGGAIRDFVMGRPIKDIDMCIDLPDGGVNFANWLKEHGYTKGSVVIYPTYGTAMFHLVAFPEEEIEVVQTRGEQYHDKGSRNPQVTFAPIEEDCVRRDLTMNALYINVSTDEVLDLTGKGVQDIKDKVCRVTNDNPDIVFTEDPLRILRVIRFSCRYGFDIDPKTFDSMKKNVDRLSIISQERITDEFSKMITSDHPEVAMTLLRITGAMHYVIPELEETYDLEQNAYHFGPVWDHTVGLLKECRSTSLEVRMACVLHDIGKIKCQTRGADGRIHFYNHEFIGAMLARDILTRMCYPNNFIDEVCFYVKWHMYTKQWGDDLSHMKDKTLRKLEYMCGSMIRFVKLMAVIDADNKAHIEEHCLPLQVDNILEYVVHEQPEDEKMFGYKLPINGNDVMEVFDLKPGPKIKQILDKCLKYAFSHPHAGKDEMLKYAKSVK